MARIKHRKEIYISVDIEAGGPIPGKNSLLSIGAVAYLDLKEVDSFSINLEEMEGSVIDPKTKSGFWDHNKEAWEACRKDQVPPKEAMEAFNIWLKGLEDKYIGKVVFVAYPAGFDFTYIYWYFIKFIDYSPFSFSCLDMKTLAMSLLGFGYRDCIKRNMPKRWFKAVKAQGLKHNHIAICDAREQGLIFIAMMKELENNKKKEEQKC